MRYLLFCLCACSGASDQRAARLPPRAASLVVVNADAATQSELER